METGGSNTLQRTYMYLAFLNRLGRHKCVTSQVVKVYFSFNEVL